MPAGVYVGGGATVVMNPPPVIFVQAFGPASSPDRWLRGKAEQVAILARALAPHRTYRLRGSIKASQNRDASGAYSFGYNVSASTPYAFYVHQGTGPSIRTSSPNKMRFLGTNQFTGQVIFTNRVEHPGTPANPFLQRALVGLAT